MKQLWLRYKATLLLLLSLSLVWLFMSLSGIGCPIKHLTGISCPGCGMSRAMGCLLRLDLSAALAYHPLCVAMPPVAAGLVYCEVKHHPKAGRLLLMLTAISLIAVYLWRLAMGGDAVVTVAPWDGLLLRGLRFLLDSLSS